MKSQAIKNEEEQNVSRDQIQDLSLAIEDLKMQVSETVREKEKIQTELQQKLEIQQKSYQTLEVKFNRSHSDMTSSHNALEELKTEYESYKVRAHNVLKQQKENSSNTLVERHDAELARLESVISELRNALSTNKDELNVTKDEHEQLEIEYEKQHALQAEFMKEFNEKENRFKHKFKQMKSEADAKDADHENKIKLLITENNKLLQFTKEQMEDVRLENEDHLKEIESLKKQIGHLKSTAAENTSRDIKREDGLAENKGSHLSLDFAGNKSLMERQEGEGMDQTELEIIDSISHHSSSSVPQTPVSPSATSILENILQHDSPQTPLAMKDELTRLKSSLQTSLKKNDHMTALLRESEANASRHYEQAIVLKEEIRRLERNEKREQDLLNMEYLKNIIVKFIRVGSTEKEQLIPVLCTMLKLSDDERNDITEFARGDRDGEEDDHNKTWSSYLYRWT